MPKIVNTEGNVSFELNLINNDFLNIDKSRSDLENRIPFELNLCVEKDVFSCFSEGGATFNVFELKDAIVKFREIINKKLTNHVSFNEKAFSCLEYCFNYFTFIVYDSMEENLLSIDLWINTEKLTNGRAIGYKRGYQFDVYLSEFRAFIGLIESQLVQLLNENSYLI